MQMIELVHISEGLRIFWRRIKVALFGVRRYPGDSKMICSQIIDACYNNRSKYFQVSAGHFCVFYCRDFGWIAESLIKLGYKEGVRNTLEYALSCFSAHGRIRTTINPGGKPFDYPYYAVDSLPYILNSLSLLGDNKLVDKHRGFLDKEIRFFFENAVDKKTGLVRKDKAFSSMKDHSIRHSSCYDNSMLFMMQKACKSLGLINPLKRYNYTKLLLRRFWNGRYFYDDLTYKGYVAGDANLFPFWTGAVSDNEIMAKAFSSVMDAGLDKPFPLCYTNNTSRVDFISAKIFVSNYEGTVAWCHMGMLYIDMMGRVDKKKQRDYLDQYTRLIMKHGNYLELFNKDGTPYNTLFYHSDDSMSWCANYLRAIKEMHARPDAQGAARNG